MLIDSESTQQPGNVLKATRKSQGIRLDDITDMKRELNGWMNDQLPVYVRSFQ
jgi:hypothetical protein